MIPPGRLFQVNFRRCAGASGPAAEEFECRVVVATDNLSNPVAWVTCAATNL